MNKKDEVISGFAQLADEFLLNIILLKKRDPTNRSLPFIHAHVLELTAKSAYYSLVPNAINQKANHNIRNIYTELSKHIQNFSSLLPKDESYEKYKQVWLKGDGPHDISSLPAPEVLQEWEVCFFIDNIVDLKYGFTKKLESVSAIGVSTNYLNPIFQKIVKVCRSTYSTEEKNKAIINKGLTVFGAQESNVRVLNDIFGDKKG